MEVISTKTSTKDILHKLRYATDLAVVADSEADRQERLSEWKEIFGRHGLRVRLEKLYKNEYQRDNFVYVGGVVCGDGSTEADIRRMTQAGTSAR